MRGFEADVGTTGGVGLDGPAGVSSVFDAAVAYRFQAPLALAAYGTFGAATGPFDTGDRTTGPRGGDVQLAVFEAVLGYDARYVALAAGSGAGLFDLGGEVEPLLVTRGRFGALDQIAFTWHASFGLQGTVIGVLGGDLEFRLSTRFWLGVDAELGNLRYGRFFADARYRLSGRGPRDVVDLKLGLGLAYVRTTSACTSAFDPRGTGIPDTECFGTNVDYLGPAASVGVLWRP